MHIIPKKALRQFWELHPESKNSLLESNKLTNLHLLGKEE